jgi:cobalt/nickel transport system permease protein
VFAAQMVNFPVGPAPADTLLAAPCWPSFWGRAPGRPVMTAILLLQALIFQDGGVLALGANVFNMALLGVPLIPSVACGVASH